MREKLAQAVDPCKDAADVWRVWALASATREHRCTERCEPIRQSMLEAGGLASLALGYGEAAGPPTLGRLRVPAGGFTSLVMLYVTNL